MDIFTDFITIMILLQTIHIGRDIVIFHKIILFYPPNVSKKTFVPYLRAGCVNLAHLNCSTKICLI